MSKRLKIDKHISILLTNSNPYLPFHKKTKLSDGNTFTGQILNIAPKSPYKAYARFPQIILPKPKGKSNLTKKIIDIPAISKLLNSLKTLIEKDRNRRLFEIYYYSIDSDFPNGLYHYYIRNHSLEKLPQFNNVELPTMAIEKKKDVKGYIFLSLRLSLLPANHKEWWYRLNISEGGSMIQRLLDTAFQNGIKMENIDFYDDTCNKFIGIDGIKESVIQLIVIY